MSILRRGRSISVLGFLIPGGIGVISSTQTWVTVQRADAGEPLAVAGADVVPLLAPLSLAVLALGAVLAIAGLLLRYVFSALGAGAAAVLVLGTVPLIVDPPETAVAAAITDATGLAGEQAIGEIVARIDPTPWPSVALVCWIALFVAALLTVVSASRWKTGGRRYRTAAPSHEHTAGPLDPVDSWDELSQGDDPTDGPR